MIRKILFIIILFFLFITFLSISSVAYSESELEVGVFGASIVTGLNRVGCFVYNVGEEDIFDVTFTFTVKGGYGDTINKIINDHQDTLQPNSSYLLTIDSINGIGPITLSIEATSSNGGSAEKSINGFQFGEYSITQTYLFAWL